MAAFTDTIFLFLLIFLCKFETNHSAESNITCFPIERNALLKFRASLIDHSNRLSSWVGEDCCTWKGVSCSNRTRHVIKLDLRNSVQLDQADMLIPQGQEITNHSMIFLKGEINPSLLDLSHLEFLDLSMNDFSSSRIPRFIGSFTKLRYLNLSSAGFVGQVPAFLGNLSRLQFLDLGTSWDFYGFFLFSPSNSLSVDSLHWVSGLSSLQHLDLSGVSLAIMADQWFQSFNALPSLLELHLSNCQLQGIPLSLDLNNLTSLEVLNLGGNRFCTPIPPLLFNLSNIQHLDLSENALNGSIPSELARFWKFLQVLDLHDNELEGGVPKGLRNLCNLHELNLENNRLSGEVFGYFGIDTSGCIKKNLRVLNLGDNHFSGYLPAELGQFKLLEYLNLGFNMFQGPIPPSLAGLSNLRHLHLYHNHLNGTVPKRFGQLSNLQSLVISDNLLDGLVSDVVFAELRNLTELVLSANSLVMDFNPSWVPPFQLLVAEMSSCKLGPQFPQWLQTQNHLLVLSMSNSSISDTIPDWFADISSSLLLLDLSHNQIRKRLPNFTKSSHVFSREIYLNANKFEGSLMIFPPDITTLDLSDNLLVGQLHQNIDQLWPNLRCLRLSGNYLNGSIPLSVCNMETLAVLDLSRNHISGTLPHCGRVGKNTIEKDRRKLENLEVMDLSYNNLHGHIPDSFGSIPVLRSLHLQNNSLEGKLPISLKQLKYLETIDLGGNAFAGSIPTWIGTLSTLKILRIHSNKFEGKIPKELCLLYGLRILDLARNRITRSIPRCFGNFSAMVATVATGGDRPAIWMFSEEYDENVLVSSKGRELVYTKTLEYLFSIDISGNRLVGEIPNELMSLTALQNVDLSGNDLQGVIPSNIGDLKLLESLDLCRNKLSGPVPPSISGLNFLSHLNLSFNNLSGRIPAGSQLQTLDDKSIYICNNGLCGHPWKICAAGDGTINEGNEQEQNGVSIEGYSEGEEWFQLGLVMGFLVGLCGVCLNLYFNKSWRNAYFQLVDKMYDFVYVTYATKGKWLHGGKFGG